MKNNMLNRRYNQRSRKLLKDEFLWIKRGFLRSTLVLSPWLSNSHKIRTGHKQTSTWTPQVKTAYSILDHVSCLKSFSPMGPW